MPVFEYKGLTEKGKAIAGVRDAESARALRQVLRKDGVFLTAVSEAAGAGGGRARAAAGAAGAGGGLLAALTKKEFEVSVPFKRRRVPAGDVAVMTRQLATLLGAGLPLVEALSAVVDQSDNKLFKTILAQVRERVNEGTSLANALGDHPKTFMPLYVNMVRAGESSGTLDLVLTRLANFTEEQVKLRAKVMGALTYPIIMMILGGLIVVLLFTVLVPRLMSIFKHIKTDLPLPTEILIGVSNFMRDWWWLMFGGALVLVWGLKRYFASEAGRLVWDRVVLTLPIFGKLVRMVAIARFTRTLATLLKSGVELLTALGIVKNILNNKVLEAVIDDARNNIKEGESIAQPLKRSGQFPPMVTHMIAVGERSGQLEEMLVNVADHYETQVNAKLQGLTSLLEPILIVGMGGVVGFIIFSVVLPIMKLNQSIGKR